MEIAPETVNSSCNGISCEHCLTLCELVSKQTGRMRAGTITDQRADVSVLASQSRVLQLRVQSFRSFRNLHNLLTVAANTKLFRSYFKAS